jgi:alkanesulfonate monooxygenase SsuD/methylene tetrahydromethanopterin reductase-like flavin-dependent oxidoreductase (luciferase family)
MRLGANVLNFGPGTDPGVLREWAHLAEGLELDALMISDHITITPDVAHRYPEPFYEPFTTLAWLAGITETVRLGTSVLLLPYRHPLLVARMAANLQDFSDGRLILGVGVGWARQEFEALGVPFAQRGALTDAAIASIQDTFLELGRGAESISLWVGGNGTAALGRARKFGAVWHPLRAPMPELQSAVQEYSLKTLAPRISLRLLESPVPDDERQLGIGTIDQVIDDLAALERLGAETVILDTYGGDPEETRRPDEAWAALTSVATNWKERP